MFKNIAICVSLFLLIASSHCLGTWYVWTNSTGNQDWNTPGNWSPAGVPTTPDSVEIDMADGNMVIIDSADDIQLQQLNAASWGPPGTVGAVRMTGGRLSFMEDAYFIIILGYVAGTDGTLYMEGGTIDGTGPIGVGGEMSQPGGTGRIIMTGGSIRSLWVWEYGLQIYKNSYIDLSGGTIEVETLVIEDAPGDTNDGYIRITDGGKLILRNYNRTTDVNSLIAANLIRGDFTVTTSGTKIIIKGNNPQCGAWGYYQMDINRDCYMDFSDFAEFALKWLACSDPQGQGCVEVVPY